MDLNKIVLRGITTFKDAASLRAELNNLPVSYEPFPDLKKEQKTGVLLFKNEIILTPMIGENKFYNGRINFPECSGGTSFCSPETQEIIKDIEFEYNKRKFVLYRTERKISLSLNSKLFKEKLYQNLFHSAI